jgi:hypothetical protein
MDTRHHASRLLAGLTVGFLLTGCAAGAGASIAVTPDASAPSAAATPTASPPNLVPSDPAGNSLWQWAEASDADTALVDRLDTAWNDNDVSAIPSLYADNAEIMTSWSDETSDLAAIREMISGTPNDYERIGGVFSVTGAAQSTGWRYLFYPLVIHGAIFDCWLEVNADSRIVNQWVGFQNA